MTDSNALKPIADYYSDKIIKHGSVPEGVDWNGEESQFLRFDQIAKVITDEPFSLNDIGCGYGAFYEYLSQKHADFNYNGYDISQEMVDVAHDKLGAHKNTYFAKAGTPEKSANYSVASGIFNVQLEYSDAEWKSYIFETLDMMNKNSSKGFSFNCLTKYSDADKMRDYLFYADPCEIFDYCKLNFSKQVALLHDYGLYEFTIIVRK